MPFNHSTTGEGMELTLAYAERKGALQGRLSALCATVEFIVLDAMPEGQRKETVRDRWRECRDLLDELDRDAEQAMLARFQTALQPLSTEAQATPIVKRLLDTGRRDDEV